MLLVISKHLDNIGRGESKHLIKLRLDRDIPTYVESARHIVQGDRAHAHHENSLKVSLELLEHITIEAISMSNGMIYFLATLIEDDIGKVVVLIDYQIKRIFVRFGSFEYQFQFFLEIFLGKNLLFLGLVIGSILTYESIEIDAQVGVELVLQLVDITRYLREIQEQHLILSLQRRRMLPYPQIAKKLLEIIALRTVIIRVEHTEEYALTETTRTDEEEVAWLLLQLRDEHRLIHIILILLYHIGKIRHSIRYSFYLLFHNFLTFNSLSYAKIRKLFQISLIYAALFCQHWTKIQ